MLFPVFDYIVDDDAGGAFLRVHHSMIFCYRYDRIRKCTIFPVSSFPPGVRIYSKYALQAHSFGLDGQQIILKGGEAG
jgi:hypothetical protein